VNRKCLLRVQYIMFCSLGLKSASHVHWTVKMAFLRLYPMLLVIYFIIHCLYIYEEVNKYEQYCDSMRQFALYIVNK
jgi:hypothetical protein